MATNENRTTILIVDDDIAMLTLMRALLKSHGYHLVFANCGQEALHQAAIHVPDLILLDVMLPDIDGLTVCEELRRNPRTAEVPIILVTSLDDRNIRIQGIEAGADDFLTKPVDGVELCARVRTITRINRYRLLLDERHHLECQARQAAQELACAYNMTLEGWARALDLRDRETEGHSRRVTDMTVRLARLLGIAEEEIVHLQRGALLHDIGKLGIPDSILQKPGPLTDEEWHIMQQHPLYAYELLAPIPFLHAALCIPLYHHEKWDGSGYPYQLRGEDIPIPARIFAVVDVWDALTNDRPYRSAWPPDVARDYIMSMSGSHFDPEVVEAFLKLIGDEESREMVQCLEYACG